MNNKEFEVEFVKPYGYTDLYSLKIGDFFMEDTFPEIYEVKKIKEGTVQNKPVTIVSTVVYGDENKEIQEWYYNSEYLAYTPILVKLRKKAERISQGEQSD